MLIFGIILIGVLGCLFLNAISTKYTLCEITGLSFPIGLGTLTIIIAIVNTLGVKIYASIIFVVTITMILLLLGYIIKYRKPNFKMPHFSLSKLNCVWLIFVAIIVYFEYMNIAKCMYFPTFDRDSLAGFDTIGYVIAQEHTLKGLSIFQSDYMPQINNAGSYITYAPMIQLSYAIVYLLGAETSKLIPALMFLSLLISFYGSIQRCINKTAAAIITFFMMITPEMLAFSSLSATNVIHATTASMGIIYISLWYNGKEYRDLYLGSLLLGINIWTRTDGVVFILAACLLLIIHSIKTKEWRCMYSLAISVSPAIVWFIISKVDNFYAESIGIYHPYWDGDKLNTIWLYMKALYSNTTYYGYSFYFFILAFIVNIKCIIKHKDNMSLFAMIVVAAILYMLALYHVDYKWDSIENVLSYSAKRFLFCFVPLVWFYGANTHNVKLLFMKIEDFLSFKK